MEEARHQVLRRQEATQEEVQLPEEDRLRGRDVSHAAVVVDEDKTKIKINSRWCQCVRERIGPDRMMDVYGIYIYFVIFSNL